MKHPISAYFRAKSAGSIDDIGAKLWTSVSAADYANDSIAYQAAILEQYQMYVEMADRISARRSVANSFFLTLNTAVFALIGSFWENQAEVSARVLAFPVAMLVAQCLTWFWIIRSYRQLNTAKWAVVGAMEKRLPAAPYSDAEWVAVGEGKDPARYWPLTHVETVIPLLFAVAYIGAFVAVLVTG